MELTPTFAFLLLEFRPVFTRPSFALFVHILTGWALTCRHRFITECIFTSGRVGHGHWSRFHRFFSHHRWSLDHLFKLLAKLLITVFAPSGPILLAADDTLCRKRGLTLYGAGMHHDPLISSRALKLVSWGHDWVVLCLLIPLPRWAPTKVFALTVGCRLYKNRQGLTKGQKKNKRRSRSSGPKGTEGSRKVNPNHRTRPELLVELLTLFASWFPDRQIVVTADSAYGGKSVLQKLPANMHLISHVHPEGGLYAPPPPPQPHQRGARRKKGQRLPGMQAWAADKTRPWQTLKFDQFGFHATVRVKVQQALYYTAGKNRLLTIVLVRDVLGKRPDQMFYCTLLEWTARTILSTYAHRWAIEVTFENAKQLLGLEDPANRLPQAVQRTAPIALLLHSLVVLWFEKGGDKWLRFPERPWYKRKVEPSFADMFTALRRLSWLEKLGELVGANSPHNKVVEELAELASRVG
jgi:DDE superfamily endonuclease